MSGYQSCELTYIYVNVTGGRTYQAILGGNFHPAISTHQGFLRV